jgi:hypothetical protein
MAICISIYDYSAAPINQSKLIQPMQELSYHDLIQLLLNC